MEILYGWVKNIIYFMIFLSVAGSLLADSKYEQYIRFFAGALLILLTVSPLLDAAGLDMRLERLFARFSSEMEAEDLKKEMWAMDGQRRNAVLEQYRAAAEADIEAMALEEGLACYGAEVTFRTEEENWGEIGGVKLYLSDAKEAAAVDEAIWIEAVRVGDESAERAGASQTAAADGAADGGRAAAREISSLKGKVALYYGLEESDIEIVGPDD